MACAAVFDNLQAAIEESSNQQPAAVLIDDPNFLRANCEHETTTTIDALDLGLIDTSDDEDYRDFQSAKYNEYGRDVKCLLSSRCSSSSLSSTHSRSSSWTKVPPNRSLDSKQLQTRQPAPAIVHDVHSEPIFGMRIINPLISSTLLTERMQGRVSVPLIKLRTFVDAIPPHTDWVVGGVIVHKTGRTSQKGNPFAIWTLSDLHGDLKTMTLFLFGSAHKEMWKCTLGTAVGVLNPSVFEKKQGSKDEAVLSVDNVQKILVLGQSKDFGTCKSTRKDGTACTSFVNLSKCEYCVYHVRQEYQKASKRSDLQSAYSGRGLTALRNKVLGKNEVFYAGKSFAALPAAKSKKLQSKDAKRLDSLMSGAIHVPSTKIEPAKRGAGVQHVEISAARRKKDLELLKKLGDKEKQSDCEVSSSESKLTALRVISKLKLKKDEIVNDAKENDTKLKESNDHKTPVLTRTKLVDLSLPVCKSKVSRANMNALKFVAKNGPIRKQDPNSVKTAKKRALDVIEKRSSPKRQKIEENEHFSERFKQIMAATSAHQDLLTSQDNDDMAQYFDKLEAKERMEEKLISTHKVQCKAVRCLQCKYTAFSSADRCKTEKHPLKVFDAVKRFFQCGECANRTVCLTVIPTHACKNCGSSKWERAGMMKERIVGAVPDLSIRGGEQTFVNSAISNANIDLLFVAED